LVLIIGRTGFGKSCTGILLMLYLDMVKKEKGWRTRFDFGRTTFHCYPFVEMITRQKENKRQWFPKGTCFMFDEVNIDASNLEFQTISTKAIVRALQTNRKYNYIILMTTPDWASVAIGIRRRATCIIEMQDKIKVDGKPYAKAKFQWVEYNYRTGEPFFKYPRAWVPEIIDKKDDGTPVVIWRKKRYKSVKIPKIPDWIEDEYNILKDNAMAENREMDLKKLRNYLGEKEREIKFGYTLRDLKSLFVKDKKIDWSLITADGKPGKDGVVLKELRKELVEYEIERFDETIKMGDVKKIWNWIKGNWHKKSLGIEQEIDLEEMPKFRKNFYDKQNKEKKVEEKIVLPEKSALDVLKEEMKSKRLKGLDKLKWDDLEGESVEISEENSENEAEKA